MWRYKILILTLTPVIVIYTLIRAVKFRDFRYLIQRLGLNKYTTLPEKIKPILIHAASVGEVIAVIPLIEQISEKYPKTPIIITSNTSTSYEIINTQLNSIKLLQHYYMPFDWNWAIRKLISSLQPRCVLIIETEIWPNLFFYCHKMNIPLMIINARLSHRTTSAKPWLLHIYKMTMQTVTRILTRSAQDYESYLQLGAASCKLKTIGNIKLASNQHINLKAIPINRPYVLAASTHEDEELQLASIWMELIKTKIVKNELLIIVPRHPDRAKTITQKLTTLTRDIAIRSKNDSITDATTIYLADTVGELKQFMLNAIFIFMGGSLIPHGGQNIIEPAQLGKAIIFGKHMFNFDDESKLLLENNAALQVNNSKELLQGFKHLLQDSDSTEQLAQSAVKLISGKHNTIVQLYLTEIEEYINN